MMETTTANINWMRICTPDHPLLIETFEGRPTPCNCGRTYDVMTALGPVRFRHGQPTLGSLARAEIQAYGR